jgi:hypothetical protein
MLKSDENSTVLVMTDHPRNSKPTIKNTGQILLEK